MKNTRKFMQSLVLSLFALGVSALLSAAEDGKDIPPLPPQQFLEALRQPLRADTWGEITGKLTCQRKGADKLTGQMRLRLTFTESSLHAQINLDDRNVYGFEQLHKIGEPIKCSLDLPENETSPSLFDFGLQPEDLTFSFLYWDFLEELPRRTHRGLQCRVLRLADPKGSGTATVCFSAEYGFPLQVSWYRAQVSKPWRELEMKGAKRFSSGMWFVKEMILQGEDWKTRVIFDFANLKTIDGAN